METRINTTDIMIRLAYVYFPFQNQNVNYYIIVLVTIDEWKKKIFRHFFYLAQQPPESQVLLIHEVSRSHTTTHHSR